MGAKLIKAYVVPPAFRLVRVGGQVPNPRTIESLAGMSQQPPDFHPAMLLQPNTPVLSARSVVENLGFDTAQENAWTNFLKKAMSTDNEVTWRQDLFARMQQEKVDPALRKVIATRAMQYWKSLRKSVQVVMVEDLKKASAATPIGGITPGGYKKIGEKQYVKQGKVIPLPVGKFRTGEFHYPAARSEAIRELAKRALTRKAAQTLDALPERYKLQVRKRTYTKVSIGGETIWTDGKSVWMDSATLFQKYGRGAIDKAVPGWHPDLQTLAQQVAGAVDAAIQKSQRSLQADATMLDEILNKATQPVLAIGPRGGKIVAYKGNKPIYQHEIGEYKLRVSSEDKKEAKEVGEKIKTGVEKAADICKISPPVCKGNLGIERKDMPQLDEETTDKFLASFKQKDVQVTDKKIPVGQLKATQKEINAEKVKGMAGAVAKGKLKLDERFIIVSKDNYVLDGHHRWATLLTMDPGNKMPVKQVDLPIRELLKEAYQFPGVKTGAGFETPSEIKKSMRMLDSYFQTFTLEKADPKGGKYHRRVPRPDGKGYRYYYDPEKYNNSQEAHVDGKEAMERAIRNGVQKAMEANPKGCPIKHLQPLVKRYGAKAVGSVLNNDVGKAGKLRYKKGKLYPAQTLTVREDTKRKGA